MSPSSHPDPPGHAIHLKHNKLGNAESRDRQCAPLRLTHTSQKDPLAADEDAPQRVLRGIDDDVDYSDISSQTTDYETRWSKQKLLGVGFEDDYNYLQHLKERPKEEHAVLVPKENANAHLAANVFGHDDDEVDDEVEDEMTDVVKGNKTMLQLPSVVFASHTEEEVGMLHRAIPPIGPQPTWDPDVVAGLDEDFDFDDPENILDDDFVMKACGDSSGDDVDDDVDDDSDVSTCDGGDFSDDFAEEETRSRFTAYSMTSSVMRRNEQLTMLDDKFEQLYSTYDDSHIGELSQVEIDGGIPVDDVEGADEIRMLLGIRRLRDDGYGDAGDADDVIKRHVRNYVESERGADDAEEYVELVKVEPKQQWDCESVLSTYSTLYNHPKLITDHLPKKLDGGKRKGEAKSKQSTAPDDNLTVDDVSTTTTMERRSHVAARKRDETREEKSERKQAAKEERKARRQEKKATKNAFRDEKQRQSKQLLNVRQNLSGIKIS